MLGLGETLARRRGLLRAMKSLRGLEDYYRRIVFSVADQTTPRDNRVGASTNVQQQRQPGCAPRCPLDSRRNSLVLLRVTFAGRVGGRI